LNKLSNQFLQDQQKKLDWQFETKNLHDFLEKFCLYRAASIICQFLGVLKIQPIREKMGKFWLLIGCFEF
jgi:hypothetical protein